MITMICGLPRAGKTALATAMALERMRGPLAFQALSAARKETGKLREGGFRRLSLDGIKHLVYADYTITSSKQQGVRSHLTDGYFIGLPNNQGHAVQLLPPYADVTLDEAQRYYNSRQFKTFPDFISRFFELHGHMYYDFRLVSQRPGLIDVNVRELAKRVIYVTELDLRRDHGFIVSCRWRGYEFASAAAAIGYIESGLSDRLRGDPFEYRYDGNVFAHYDSHGCRGAFLRDCYGKSFDCKDAREYGYTVADVKAYNADHPLDVPATFRLSK